MKETCYKLFSYWSIDSKAAQAFLNEMAARGWELDRVVLGLFARFRRTGRRDLSYFLDWTDLSEQEDPDYVRLCADAGWEKKARLGSAILYVSRPGMRPVPIQTDPEIEYQRFRKKTLWVIPAFLVGLLFLLAIPLFTLGGVLEGQKLPYFLLDSNLMTFLLLSLPLLVLGICLYLCYFAWRFWRLWRSHRQGEDLSRPGAVSARLWGLLRVLAAGYTGVALLCFYGDMLLNYPMYTYYYSASCVIFLLPLLNVLFLHFRPEKKWRLIRGPIDVLELLLIGLMVLFLLGVFPESDVIPSLKGYTFLCLLVIPIGWFCLPRQMRPTGWRAWVIRGILLFLVCGLLHDPVRTAFPGHIPAGPVLSGTVSLHGERTDTPLGGEARWYEEYADGPMVSFSAYCWPTADLAQKQLAQNAKSADRVPGRRWQTIEGYEGVYRLVFDYLLPDSDYDYFILRDNTVLSFSSPMHGEMEEDLILSAALNWLEGGEPHES